MRYAIYGAGSLGTVLGAYITQRGVDIDLINRNRAHVEALNRHGARVTGTVSMTVPVKAMTPEHMQGPYDVILLLTKQLDNAAVVTMLKEHLREDGVLVTLQNGLPEPGIAAIVGQNRTMGCVVEWGATLAAPGEAVLTSAPDSLSFHMGKMEGISDRQYAMVKALLENMCPVHEESNLLGARWSKLLINATFSGLGTVLGGTFGSVSERADARQIAVRCMKECMEVGKAEGIVFAPVQGKDLTRLFGYRSAFKRFIATLLIPIAMKKHRNIEPSMLQDLKHGKPTEVDAINGIICAYGRKHGVPTPINDRIVELIKKGEQGNISMRTENIRLFDDCR